MSIRTTLLGIGALFWLSALGCWWRARGVGGRLYREAAVFVALGLPFLIAGAFYTASSYPGESRPAVSTPTAALEPAPPAALEAVAREPAPPFDYAAAVLAAQRAAVARYPALGVAETPFNRAFLAAYRRIQRTEPDYFDDPQWPLRLADEVAGEFAPGAP